MVSSLVYIGTGFAMPSVWSCVLSSHWECYPGKPIDLSQHVAHIALSRKPGSMSDDKKRWKWKKEEGDAPVEEKRK